MWGGSSPGVLSAPVPGMRGRYLVASPGLNFRKFGYRPGGMALHGVVWRVRFPLL